MTAEPEQDDPSGGEALVCPHCQSSPMETTRIYDWLFCRDCREAVSYVGDGAPNGPPLKPGDAPPLEVIAP